MPGWATRCDKRGLARCASDAAFIQLLPRRLLEPAAWLGVWRSKPEACNRVCFYPSRTHITPDTATFGELKTLRSGAHQVCCVYVYVGEGPPRPLWHSTVCLWSFGECV